MANSKLFETLESRGYLYQFTDKESVKNLLNGKPMCAYVGIDPTADSLHIGHCLPLVMAKYLQDAGHKIIVVLGGATAMIGDPSGKSDMRKMVSDDFVNINRPGIEKAIGKFLKLDGQNPVTIVNNADWFKGYDYINFMRDIGVHFNVNKMLSCDAYKNRIESGGLTFFEMGYMLMQAYDFVYLNKKYGCSLEFGGSDQWANILAGADLGRKLALQNGENPENFQAMTNVLLLTADGKKMGKTEKGALWVDKDKTSTFDFYQYFYNIDDRDVEKLLKILTYVSLEEIEIIMSGDIRVAKKRMAYEITKLVHGEEEAKKAMDMAQNIFTSTSISEAPIFEIGNEMISLPLVDTIVLSGICQTKSEARRMIEQNAISLNGEAVCDFKRILMKDDFSNGFAILKKGKKTFKKLIIK